uniref:Uncharacterized protein n=1 Tax=Meloidogyne javanica TaxID=6303 RepID=A0A915LE03_MELJA
MDLDPLTLHSFKINSQLRIDDKESWPDLFIYSQKENKYWNLSNIAICVGVAKDERFELAHLVVLERPQCTFTCPWNLDEHDENGRWYRQVRVKDEQTGIIKTYWKLIDDEFIPTILIRVEERSTLIEISLPIFFAPDLSLFSSLQNKNSKVALKSICPLFGQESVQILDLPADGFSDRNGNSPVPGTLYCIRVQISFTPGLILIWTYNENYVGTLDSFHWTSAFMAEFKEMDKFADFEKELDQAESAFTKELDNGLQIVKNMTEYQRSVESIRNLLKEEQHEKQILIKKQGISEYIIENLKSALKISKELKNNKQEENAKLTAQIKELQQQVEDERRAREEQRENLMMEGKLEIAIESDEIDEANIQYFFTLEILKQMKLLEDDSKVEPTLEEEAQDEQQMTDERHIVEHEGEQVLYVEDMRSSRPLVLPEPVYDESDGEGPRTSNNNNRRQRRYQFNQTENSLGEHSLSTAQHDDYWDAGPIGWSDLENKENGNAKT